MKENEKEELFQKLRVQEKIQIGREISYNLVLSYLKAQGKPIPKRGLSTKLLNHYLTQEKFQKIVEALSFGKTLADIKKEREQRTKDFWGLI